MAGNANVIAHKNHQHHLEVDRISLSVFSVVLATLQMKLLTVCSCNIHSHAKHFLKIVFFDFFFSYLQDNNIAIYLHVLTHY